ncbi:MAG: lipase [Acidimicrobiia bacterium]|nr:lipase [Acidimicrobiia bacterium]
MADEPVTPDSEPTDGDTPPRPHHRATVVGLVLLGLLLLVGVAGALAIRGVEPSAPDAFYTAPDPLPDVPPGSVLRLEEFTPSLVTARGWKVLYVSTDPQGQPLAVSGVVLAPRDPAPQGSRQVVAWAHGTSGVAERCAPSLLDDPLELMSGVDDLIANGWVVAATDYPGLGTQGPHPYLVGQSEARAVLDSVRAAAAIDGTEATSTFGLWGHSQGGHAAVWSAIIAADYAPELTLVGTAAAAPALLLGKLFEADEGTSVGNLLTSYALSSWSDYYPEADIDAITSAVARPSIDAIARGCIESKAQILALGLPVEALRATFLTADPVTTEPWSTYIEENTPTGPVSVPLLVTQGTADTVVRPFTNQEAMTQRCTEGEDVELRWYPGLDHLEVATQSAPDVAVWLRDRFAGEPASSNCDAVLNDPPPPGAEPPADDGIGTAEDA